MRDSYRRFSGRNRLYEYRWAGRSDKFYDIRIIDFPLQIILIGRQYILPYELCGNGALVIGYLKTQNIRAGCYMRRRICSGFFHIDKHIRFCTGGTCRCNCCRTLCDGRELRDFIRAAYGNDTRIVCSIDDFAGIIVFHCRHFHTDKLRFPFCHGNIRHREFEF